MVKRRELEVAGNEPQRVVVKKAKKRRAKKVIDVFFVKRKKEKEKQGELLCTINVKVGLKEFEVLSKKAEILGKEIGEYAREYFLYFGAFDTTVIAEKKLKAKS